MTLYGLKKKGKFEFPLIVKELKDLEPCIENSYWANYGMSKKGSNYSREDFMKDKLRVKIEITELKEKIDEEEKNHKG